jgi:hypothetical protein
LDIIEISDEINRFKFEKIEKKDNTTTKLGLSCLIMQMLKIIKLDDYCRRRIAISNNYELFIISSIYLDSLICKLFVLFLDELYFNKNSLTLFLADTDYIFCFKMNVQNIFLDELELISGKPQWTVIKDTELFKFPHNCIGSISTATE